MADQSLALTESTVQELRKRLGLETFYATIGDSDDLQSATIKEPGRPGYIRVRLQNDDMPYRVVKSSMLGAFTPLPGVAVELKYDSRGELAIVQGDFNGLLQAGINPEIYNSGDPAMSAFNQTDGLLPLLSGAVSGGNTAAAQTNEVFVNRFRFVDKYNVVRDFPGALLDLSAYVPPANQHRYVALFLKIDDLTIEVKTSTAKATITPLADSDKQECYNTRSDGTIPVFLWRLHDAQSYITNKDRIEDLRPWMIGQDPARILSNPVDVLEFNTAYTPDGEPVGSMYWNAVDGTLDTKLSADFTMGVGQHNIVPLPLTTNNTGVTINKASVVALVTDTTTTEIVLANSRDPDIASKVVGITAQDIADTETGYVMTFGLIRDVNTSTYTLDDILYVSPTTPGGLTATRPDDGDYPIPIAQVVKVGTTDGIIFVRCSPIKDPDEIQSATGFPEQDTIPRASFATFDDPTYTFSITPNTGDGFSEYHYYHKGIKYIKTTADTYQINPSIEGFHFFYFDGPTLEVITNPTQDQFFNIIRNYTRVARVYWSVAQAASVALIDARHGYQMSPDTHINESLKGAFWVNGMGLSGMVIGDGSLDSHAQFGIEPGSSRDADLFNITSAVPSTSGIPLIWTATVNNYARAAFEPGFPVLTDITAGVGTTGRLVYNDITTGTLVTVGNTNFVLCHVVTANNLVGGFKHAAFIGQNEYNTLPAAQAGAGTEIDNIVTRFNLSGEIVRIATVIFQTQNLYGNSVKAKIVLTGTGAPYVDWRSTTSATAGATPSSHTILTELGWGSSLHSSTAKSIATFNASGIAQDQGNLLYDDGGSFKTLSITNSSGNANAIINGSTYSLLRLTGPAGGGNTLTDIRHDQTTDTFSISTQGQDLTLNINGFALDSGARVNDIDTVIEASPTNAQLLTALAIKNYVDGKFPLTTKGDLFTYSTVNARLPVGTNGQVLSADSGETTGLKWITISGGGDGWIPYSAVIPTRASADDPTYVLTFSGADLTGIISPGMKLKWTQNSIVRYGICTAISFSTDTTLTLYGGTDYDVDDTGTFPISGFNYSIAKTPLGFPMNRIKWTVVASDSVDRIQSSPIAGTWYNLGGFSASIPIGMWSLEYNVALWANNTAGTNVGCYSSLSTSASSENDSDFRAFGLNNMPTGNIGAGVSAQIQKDITLSGKATYYLISSTPYAGIAAIYNYNATIKPAKIRAYCRYL